MVSSVAKRRRRKNLPKATWHYKDPFSMELGSLYRRVRQDTRYRYGFHIDAARFSY